MMRLPRVLAAIALALGCQAGPAYPYCLDYLKAKGFDPPLFAQVQIQGTTKNINDQIPALLDVLRESRMIAERPVEPAFTIGMQTGSSLASQTMDIQIGRDGYCVIQHVRDRAFIYSSELPAFAEAAFDESEIIVTGGKH